MPFVKLRWKYRRQQMGYGGMLISGAPSNQH